MTIPTTSHAPRPPHAQPPAGVAQNPYVLQILMTEHWSLLSSRSLGYTEAMSRASIFIAVLAGAVVGIAVFLATLFVFAAWGVRAVAHYRSRAVIRFPSPDRA
jgi:hypothetical protein